MTILITVLVIVVVVGGGIWVFSGVTRLQRKRPMLTAEDLYDRYQDDNPPSTGDTD